MSHNVCYSSKNRPVRSARLLMDDGAINVHVGDVVEYRHVVNVAKNGFCSVLKRERCYVRYVGGSVLDLVPIDGLLKGKASRYYIIDLFYANKCCNILSDVCLCNNTVVRVGDIVKEVDTLGIDFDWCVVKFARGRVYCYPVEHGCTPFTVVAFKPSDVVLKEKN